MKTTLLAALSTGVMTYLTWTIFKVIYKECFVNVEEVLYLSCLDSSQILLSNTDVNFINIIFSTLIIYAELFTFY